MKIISFLILLLASQIFCDVGTTDSFSSGDGEESVTRMTSFTMIDENGDITESSRVTEDQHFNDPLVIMTDMDEADVGNTTERSLSLTTETTMTSADTTMFVDTTTTTTTTTTEASTTTVLTTPSTTEVTTTNLDITTITAPETTTPMTSTYETTKMPTTTTTTTTTSTTTSSPVTDAMEPMSTTGTDTPKVPTMETTAPEPEGTPCVFIDHYLECSEEIYCYGEGVIDCSEELDLNTIPSKITIIEKLSPSSISEDYSDYDAAEGIIATFPPNLVGVSPKKRLPFLFKMQHSLDTTDMSSESSSETRQEYSSTKSSVTTLETSTETSTMRETTEAKTTLVIKEDMPDFKEDKTLNANTKAEEATESFTTISVSNITQETETLYSTQDLVDAETTIDEANGTVTTLEPVTVTEHVTLHSMLSTLQGEESVSATVVEDSSQKNANIRRKREDNMLSSRSGSFHVAALEGSKQKIRVKACELSGNLKCRPTPTTSMCKGKTYCRVSSGTSETSEKSTSAKGVENWAIAVIAICAIAALLTVSLLVYIVVTSCKKLKVQPQSGVTTLNYVNSTPP